MTGESADSRLRVAIAGLGTIGLAVAHHIDRGRIEGMVLAAIASGSAGKAEAKLAGFANPPPVVPIVMLGEEAEVIVECAPAAVFAKTARAALEHGRFFMPLSVGALLDHMELVDLARKTGGRIIVPTGALLGLDAVRAAALGTIEEVTLATRKPPQGLKGAPYLAENDISVENLSEAMRLFAGSAREAAEGFPANLNVAAALALAGIGPDATQVEIWADPAVTRNTHTITVKSDSANFTMTIENMPSAENPRTGKITALSVIAALERLASPLVIGS